MFRPEFVPLYAALATYSYMPTANGQSTCETDDQCDVGYYCVEKLYTCDKCVVCENFKQGDSCAKSIIDCGSASDCIDGYKFTKDGRCIPASITSTIVVSAVAVTVLVVVFVAGAVHVLRRKKDMLYINPENGLYRVRATAPIQEPEYLDDRPPSYNRINFDRTLSPINNDTKTIMEPLLIPDGVVYADQPLNEGMQRATMANPPRYVRIPDLPPNVNHQNEEPPPPPAPENIPLNIIAGEREELNGEENEEVEEEEFIEQNQPTQLLPPLQITLNINNTNSANLLAIQRQEQYTHTTSF